MPSNFAQALSLPKLWRFRPLAALFRACIPACIAAAIVLTQTLAVPLVTRMPYAQSRTMLLIWDSGWYRKLAENGYTSNLPRTSLAGLSDKEINDRTNVAFFPAYPLLIRVVRALTGMATASAMLLVSQGAAVAMWTYLLLLMRRLKVMPAAQAAVVALAVAHPGAFFQVAGYSESIFLASLLGFVYWTLDRNTPAAPALAAVHGALMSATKLVGLPVALLPLVLEAWRRYGARKKSTHFATAALDAALAATGGAAFLVYCQLRFGHWDLYMLRQSAGWGIHPDVLFFLHSPTFLIPQVTQPLLASGQVGRFVTAATGWLLLLCLLSAARSVVRGTRQPEAHIALLWAAFATFFIFTASFADLAMEAMLRHLFTPYVLLLVVAAEGASRAWKAAWNRHEHLLLLLCGLACCGMLAVQLNLLARFVAGQWVA